MKKYIIIGIFVSFIIISSISLSTYYNNQESIKDTNDYACKINIILFADNDTDEDPDPEVNIDFADIIDDIYSMIITNPFVLAFIILMFVCMGIWIIAMIFKIRANKLMGDSYSKKKVKGSIKKKKKKKK